MLLQRIITAIPIAIAIIWVILFQSSDVFLYLLCFISLIAGFEWFKLCGSSSNFMNGIYALLVTAISFVFVTQFEEHVIWYIYASALFWSFILIFIKFSHPQLKVLKISPLKLIIGLLVIPSAVISMWAVHKVTDGGQWLMYGLALVWVADIGAYFSGKRFGKNSLAKNISPGKTIEGLIGALILTSVYSLLFGYYIGLNQMLIMNLILISLVLTVVSVVGDLFESCLKREMGVKDSGNILPGHGGILDRIDSVLAAMPMFSLAMHFFLKPVYGI